jgi:hypothetical protein
MSWGDCEMAHVSGLIDLQTVSDLAMVLDPTTREDLLRSFANDAGVLIETMQQATGKELAQARHALIGVAGMIGASGLRALAQRKGSSGPEMRAMLAETITSLEEVFRSAAPKGRE